MHGLASRHEFFFLFRFENCANGVCVLREQRLRSTARTSKKGPQSSWGELNRWCWSPRRSLPEVGWKGKIDQAAERQRKRQSNRRGNNSACGIVLLRCAWLGGPGSRPRSGPLIQRVGDNGGDLDGRGGCQRGGCARHPVWAARWVIRRELAQGTRRMIM